LAYSIVSQYRIGLFCKASNANLTLATNPKMLSNHIVDAGEISDLITAHLDRAEPSFPSERVALELSAECWDYLAEARSQTDFGKMVLFHGVHTGIVGDQQTVIIAAIDSNNKIMSRTKAGVTTLFAVQKYIPLPSSSVSDVLNYNNGQEPVKNWLNDNFGIIV